MKIVLLLLLIVGISYDGRSNFNFEQNTKEFLIHLNDGDSARFMQHFQPTAIVYNITENGMEQLAIKDFSQVLQKFKAKQFREEFTSIKATQLESGLTYVDIDFTFYINEVVAFKGVDHVLWVKDSTGVKITSYYSGALKPKFTTSSGGKTSAGELDLLMNKWHVDVAESNMKAYFDFMSDNFIFLGTDPSERWTSGEFESFCKPYFDKKSTWNFTPNWRNWYFSSDEQTAWFEESLDTWMEECRASGVMEKINGSWKISHYNLTVLIENDKVDKFIKPRKK